jgi:hypothetical protein
MKNPRLNFVTVGLYGLLSLAMLYSECLIAFTVILLKASSSVHICNTSGNIKTLQPKSRRNPYTIAEYRMANTMSGECYEGLCLKKSLLIHDLNFHTINN